MIVQRLRALQNEFGYLPDAKLRDLARELDVPLYRIQEVAGFFPLFRQEWNKPPYVEVQVCRDMTCHHRGAADLLSAKGLKALDRVGEFSVEVVGVSCLGRCDRAPAVCVNRHPPHNTGVAPVHEAMYLGRTPAELRRVVGKIVEGQDPPPPDTDEAHRPNGYDPKAWQIDPYPAHPEFKPYEAVKRLLVGNPHPVPPPARAADARELSKYIEEKHPFLWQMQLAGLLGMGGAGMPTYQKWLDVWRADGDEKYVVMNGDESEPGTFKDRELLLRTPHLVVEGVILAGLITGATAGYVYVRHEYHEGIEAVRREIERAAGLGACGVNIFGSGRDFPVEVFESPGGYICGEQSALLEAMEDRRSMPRNRPPELTTNGLRDKPTVVNNVESLCWAPSIMLNGGPWYAGLGRPGYKGRRFFSISGDVERPGVYEVPVGITLRELVDDYAGGMLGGKPLKAVAPSGPSGGLLPARFPVDAKTRHDLGRGLERLRERSAVDAERMAAFLARALPADGPDSFDVLDLPLDLNFWRGLQGLFKLPVEMMLGAGLAVYAEGADVLGSAVAFARFFRNESCGKCVPCRIGSQKLVDIGTDLLARRDAAPPTMSELDDVRRDVKEMTRVLQQTSICGLGYVAPIPLASTLSYFAAEIAVADSVPEYAPPDAAVDITRLPSVRQPEAGFGLQSSTPDLPVRPKATPPGPKLPPGFDDSVADLPTRPKPPAEPPQ